MVANGDWNTLDKGQGSFALSLSKGLCPCGQSLKFVQCCGRYISDFEGTPAPDAQTLMRSRYTAFVLANRNYLIATWHPEQCPVDLQLGPGVKWLGLEVRHHKQIDDSHAEVEFVARSRGTGGKGQRLHERSRFVRDNGRWYYLDGDLL